MCVCVWKIRCVSDFEDAGFCQEEKDERSGGV